MCQGTDSAHHARNSRHSDFALKNELVGQHQRDGDVFCFVKSLKYQRSTSYEQTRNQLYLMDKYPALFRMPGSNEMKPVLVIMVDGGQDENPRFYGQIMSSAQLFMRCQLQLLILFTRAGGFSSLNSVERAQCWVTCALSGCKFPSDHYGKVKLDEEGQPRTQQMLELEKSNHEYACLQVVKCINACNAYDKPMQASIPPAPKECDENLAIDDEALE